jgi:hypothetical protein
MWFKDLCRNNTIEEQEKERLADKLMMEELRKAFLKLKEEGHLKD